MVGRRLAEALGVQVVIENRPGSDGTIGSDLVAKSPPDGYTIMIDGTSQAYNVASARSFPTTRHAIWCRSCRPPTSRC
jgi:tripartite-type tricarboxylate transporter receptor subunit TctC